MTVEGILQFLGLVAFEIVVAILFNAFSTMQKRKLPYLICAISPLAAMMMFHSRYIGNDSLNYYNLFLQTSRATVQDLLTNTRFEHGYLLLNWLIGRFTANPQWLYICIGTFMSIALIWWVYKYIPAPGLLCILLVEMLMVDGWISIARQTITVGILLIAYKFLIQEKLIKFLILVLIATRFHNAAWIFLLAYPIVNWHQESLLKSKGNLPSFELIVSAVAIVSYVSLSSILSSILDTFTVYSYYQNGEMMAGDARLASILQFLVGMLMMFVPQFVEKDNVKELKKNDIIARSLYMLGVISLGIMFIAIKATVFTRLAGIFTIFRVSYYVYTTSKFKFKRNKLIMIVVSILVFGIYGLVITIMKTPDWQTTYPFLWFWSNN